jgi:hypothetical protein
LASVNVITQKEVIGIRRESTILEQTQKIVILSMDITYKVHSMENYERKGRRKSIAVEDKVYRN